MDNNQLLERCIGFECILTLGSAGGSVKGTVLSLRDNWLELETKRDVMLVNADHVSHIHITRRD